MSDTAVLKENERRRAEKLAAWRKTQRRTLTVAGLEVTVKRTSVLDWAAEGNVPQHLQEIADQYVTGKIQEIEIRDLARVLPLINAVVRACVVEPPLADAEDETHLTIAEIPTEERVKIFRWANGDEHALDETRVSETGSEEMADGADAQEVAGTDVVVETDVAASAAAA